MWILMSSVVSWIALLNAQEKPLLSVIPLKPELLLPPSEDWSKCCLTFSPNSKLVQSWLSCHTSNASNKIPSAPSQVVSLNISLFVFLGWRVLLPAPLWIRECPCCLRRPEYVRTKGHGQNQEGKTMEMTLSLSTWLTLLCEGKCHADISRGAHNSNHKRCLIYSQCGSGLIASVSVQIPPSMPLCCPAGFLRSPISPISITEPEQDEPALN